MTMPLQIESETPTTGIGDYLRSHMRDYGLLFALIAIMAHMGSFVAATEASV